MTWLRVGNRATEASSRAISASAGGWMNTGRPNVASVTNTSHGTGTKASQVVSGARL